MRTIHLMFFCLFCSILIPGQAQEPASRKDLIKKAATDIISRVPYCALITLDSTGHPQARTMDPFAPDDNFVIWFGTNPKRLEVVSYKDGLTGDTITWRAPNIEIVVDEK